MTPPPSPVKSSTAGRHCQNAQPLLPELPGRRAGADEKVTEAMRSCPASSSRCVDIKGSR